MKYLFIVIALIGCVFLPAPYVCVGWFAVGVQLGWMLRGSTEFYK